MKAIPRNSFKSHNLKSKLAAYQKQVNPKLMGELKIGIENIIVKNKKYLLSGYSVKDLAKDLGTNTRYIAATIAQCYNMNYTSFVNINRINKAKKLLKDKSKNFLTIEEIGDMVGFSSRQTFYDAFRRFENMTPGEFKLKMLDKD